MEFLEWLKDIFFYNIYESKEVTITVATIAAVILAFMVSSYVLKVTRKIVTRRLPPEDKNKFISIFQFLKYLVYVIVIVFTLNASGVNMSVFLTASAALFVGLGFALQQLFQDIISGVLMILDQSMHIGDIVEINGIVGRVEEIRLRSTRVVSRDGRVLVVPNHKFMLEVLYNYTQNNNIVRENVTVGVAYGSDLELVRKLLEEVAMEHPTVLKDPKPFVFFDNFGDSSLDFILYFFIGDGFRSPAVKSDLRFSIDAQFRKHNVTIPFPQRDVHIFEQK